MSDATDNERNLIVDSKDPIWLSVALGTTAGITLVAVGHPLDTIKVRLQTNTTKNLFRNLYKGVLPPFLAVTPCWMASYFAYGSSLKLLDRDDIIGSMRAGAIAGSAYSFVTTPFEMVKVNAQNSHRSTFESFRAVVQRQGLRGLYKGIGATLIRDMSQGACYFGMAEYLGQSTGLKRIVGEDAAPFVVGMITGISHCTVEFGPDCVKTRFQTGAYKSYAEVFSSFNKGDLHRMSTGYGVWITRAIIGHGCSFAMMDQVKKRLILADCV